MRVNEVSNVLSNSEEFEVIWHPDVKRVEIVFHHDETSLAFTIPEFERLREFLNEFE